MPEFLTKRNLIILGVATALMVGNIAAYYFVGSTPKPQPTAQDEVITLLAQIGTLIVLPADETPIVATVNDPEQLKGQAFFANAKKGDKVLIYNKARKAILYSPALNRVIDVAPLSSATPSPSVAPKQ